MLNPVVLYIGSNELLEIYGAAFRQFESTWEDFGHQPGSLDEWHESTPEFNFSRADFYCYSGLRISSYAFSWCKTSSEFCSLNLAKIPMRENLRECRPYIDFFAFLYLDDKVLQLYPMLYDTFTNLFVRTIDVVSLCSMLECIEHRLAQYGGLLEAHEDRLLKYYKHSVMCLYKGLPSSDFDQIALLFSTSS
jgi:hypothetical protein